MEYQHRSGRPDAWLPIIVAVFATLAAAASYATAPQSKQTASAPVTKTAGPRDAYGHLPLSFEESRGQTDSRVKFLARGGGYSLFLTPTEAVLKLRAQSAAKNPRRPGALPKRLLRASTEKQFSVVRIGLENANANSSARGVDLLRGRSNYFIGKDRSKWRTGIATYGGIRFESIYPGISLVYRGTQGRLEYDFVVAPNADPSRIRMSIEGADHLSLDRDGNLIIKTPGGEVVQKAPIIYQETHDTRHPVAGGYALLGKRSIAFKLAAYDRSAPLIIDPLLTYVSYLGGSGIDEGTAIAVDSTGAAWVTGETTSTDFPTTTNAFQPDNYGSSNVFITKVSPDGTALIYSTYAGGTGNDSPIGIGLDSFGNAYVTGFTDSSDYAVSSGAYQVSPGNIFVTALDSTGGLIYSTYLGSPAKVGPGGIPELDLAGIAVDGSGEAFVAGGAGAGIPLAGNPYQSSCPSADQFLGGNPDCGFVTKLNPPGTSLVYSTLVGNAVDVNAIGIDAAGEAYITGTLMGIDSSVGPTNCQSCLYEAKLDGSGSNLLFSQGLKYHGGDTFLAADSIAVDPCRQLSRDWVCADRESVFSTQLRHYDQPVYYRAGLT